MISYIFFFALMLGATYCLWRMSATDFARRIIPDVYLFPFMIIGFVVVCWFPWVTSPQSAAMGAAMGYTLSSITGWIFARTNKDATDTSPIGMGDIKLIGAGGIWLGPTGLSIALAISCALGIIWGIRKHQRFIPFAPFFAIGGILALIALRFLL